VIADRVPKRPPGQRSSGEVPPNPPIESPTDLRNSGRRDARPDDEPLPKNGSLNLPAPEEGVCSGSTAGPPSTSTELQKRATEKGDLVARTAFPCSGRPQKAALNPHHGPAPMW
jgi:hypothetical protein